METTRKINFNSRPHSGIATLSREINFTIYRLRGLESIVHHTISSKIYQHIPNEDVERLSPEILEKIVSLTDAQKGLTETIKSILKHYEEINRPLLMELRHIREERELYE